MVKPKAMLENVLTVERHEIEEESNSAGGFKYTWYISMKKYESQRLQLQ